MRKERIELETLGSKYNIFTIRQDAQLRFIVFYYMIVCVDDLFNLKIYIYKIFLLYFWYIRAGILWFEFETTRILVQHFCHHTKCSAVLSYYFKYNLLTYLFTILLPTIHTMFFSTCKILFHSLFMFSIILDLKFLNTTEIFAC